MRKSNTIIKDLKHLKGKTSFGGAYTVSRNERRSKNLEIGAIDLVEALKPYEINFKALYKIDFEDIVYDDIQGNYELIKLDITSNNSYNWNAQVVFNFDEIEVINVLITCNDPYWKELLEIMTEINRIKSNFKFPFSIKKKGMPFSIIRDSVNATIYNKSSETGMEIRFYFTDTVTSPMIYDIDDNTKYIWLKDITFNKGETVVITTEGSPKKITKYDVNGTPSNILYTASENLTWLKIKKGINRLGVKATNTDELKHIEVVVSWRRKYKGV